MSFEVRNICLQSKQHAIHVYFELFFRIAILTGCLGRSEIEQVLYVWLISSKMLVTCVNSEGVGPNRIAKLYRFA